MMGAPLQIPTPGLSAGLNPFALTTYVGWALGLVTVVAALTGQHRLLLLALVPGVLSLGIGPWYELPVLSMLRFPYRWHLATLAIVGLAAGRVADQRRWWWLPVLVVTEGLLLSPIEPILPGAPSTIPAIYAQVDAPLLEVPGPVSRPPGEINASRPRARYFLYYQTGHGQPSPWSPDFNGLGASAPSPHLDPFRRFDRLESGASWEADARLLAGDLAALRAAGVGLIMVQRDELGARRARVLDASLTELNAALVASDDARSLYRLPP
jgi:hypothetical protein